MHHETIHLEDVIIGALIKSQELIDEVMGSLKPEDFYSNLHREIYRQLLIMHREQTLTTDIGLLADQIKIHGCDQNTVMTEIFEICNRAPDVSSIILEYVKIIKVKRAEEKKVAALNLYSKQLAQGEKISSESIARKLEEIDSEIPTDIVSYSALVDQTLDNLSELNNSERETSGIPSGFISLDGLTCGFQPGNLIILAARPSTGKTMLALQIADFVAIEKKLPVVFISLEMTSAELIKRTLSRLCQIDNTRMIQGKFTAEDWESISKIILSLSESPLYINDKATLAVNDIRAYCKRVQKKYGLSLIIVDYLSLIKEPEGENEHIRIGNISSSLKALAKDLKVPIICLCQLNRNCEALGRIGKPLVLSDLRSSGQIEQDADLVIFLERTNNDEMINCVIAKQRNGRLGSIQLKADFKYSNFDEEVYY